MKKENQWIYDLKPASYPVDNNIPKIDIIAEEMPTPICYRCEHHETIYIEKSDGYYPKRICNKKCTIKGLDEECEHYKKGNGLKVTDPEIF